jgi:hypothetical protein
VIAATLGLLGVLLLGLGAWLEARDTYPRVTDADTFEGWQPQTPESP